MLASLQKSPDSRFVLLPRQCDHSKPTSSLLNNLCASPGDFYMSPNARFGDFYKLCSVELSKKKATGFSFRRGL